MPGVILRLQIEDNNLKQRYAKDMPTYGKDNYLKLWGTLPVKAVTTVKALQLLHDLYKLSQLRLAVTAIKAV